LIRSPLRGSLRKIQYNTVPYRSERASEASGVPPFPWKNEGWQGGIPSRPRRL